MKYIIWRTWKKTPTCQLTEGYEDAPDDDYEIKSWLESKGFVHNIANVFSDDKRIWCEEMLSEDFTNFNQRMFFKSNEDKVKFILRWVE